MAFEIFDRIKCVTGFDAGFHAYMEDDSFICVAKYKIFALN